ncbi:MAG: RNB domain-containing ribonuclease [Ornithinimicrobium sp.]
MAARSTTLHTPSSGGLTARLEAVFAATRKEAGVREGFPEDVVRAAERAAGAPQLPERDESAVEFVTIDPPGSMDLDQALHIEPAESQDEGESAVQAAYRVRYAIADVPAFVQPGGTVDSEVRLRGQTVYCPDTRVPLHPAVISEEAASLLPGVMRPAYVWDIVLGPTGERVEASVYRAMVRSRRRFTYAEVQAGVDDGSAEQTLMLLREVGRLRVQRESDRRGASLPMPEQEVHVEDDQYVVRFRPVLEAEEWNAQISLLTGMVAAQMMLDGKVGILRTMPAADKRSRGRFRRQARALGVPWPDGMAYGDFLRTLDRSDPAHLALIHDATALFRGAGYTPFDGDLPQQREQAALAAPYAHVTAPLRRLVDRYGLAICEALSRGEAAPAWTLDALPDLPQVMQASGSTARAVERGCLDAVEAAVLESRVGEAFAAVVVDETSGGIPIVQITHPAITAKATGDVVMGSKVHVKVVAVDVPQRTVELQVVSGVS